MGTLAQQPQPSVMSTSWKSAANKPPIMLPPRATCTANVSLSIKETKASNPQVRAEAAYSG